MQSISSRLNNSRATNVNRSAISLYTSGRIRRRKHPHSKKKMLPRVHHGGRPPPAGATVCPGRLRSPCFWREIKQRAGYFYSKRLFFFIFCLPCVADGILFPQSRIEPASLEAGSLYPRDCQGKLDFINFPKHLGNICHLNSNNKW